MILCSMQMIWRPFQAHMAISNALINIHGWCLYFTLPVVANTLRGEEDETHN